MKKLIFYSVLIVLVLSLSNCQPVLKAPAAAIMSTVLPTPEIDTTINQNRYPETDFSLRVKDLNGNTVNMSDYKGKVIFLNFWATWCMPCVAELPSINKLYLELKDENIIFLLISNEDPDKVRRYQTKKGYQIPFQISDNDGHIPDLFYSRSIPTTFIINKEGRVIRKSLGPENWNDDEFILELRKLL